MNKISVTYQGRAYPTPQQARETMKRVLDRMGITVPDEDIVADEEMPGTFCPWGAHAMVDQDVWEAAKEAVQRP